MSHFYSQTDKNPKSDNPKWESCGEIVYCWWGINDTTSTPVEGTLAGPIKLQMYIFSDRAKLIINLTEIFEHVEKDV